MNTLYLICSHSCMAQMEIAYLLNNSPELYGESNAGENYATYQLDGKDIDYEPGILGKVRCHDDYWNLTDYEKQYYNFEIRNTLEIREDQLDGLLNISKSKSVALLLHAHNTKDIWRWSRKNYAVVVNATIGDWDMDIENWAMREYNDIMEDDRNANYSEQNHIFPGTQDVILNFVHKMRIDREWKDKNSFDYSIEQVDWMRSPEIYNLWEKVGLQPPSKKWVDEYLIDIKSKQEYNTQLLNDIRLEYDSVR